MTTKKQQRDNIRKWENSKQIFGLKKQMKIKKKIREVEMKLDGYGRNKVPGRAYG